MTGFSGVSREARLLAILGITRDTSMHGAGRSLRDAIAAAGYTAVRNQLVAADLVPLLEAGPEFIEQWACYSRDKRTSGGWYLDGTSVGQVEHPKQRLEFSSRAEVVADYVVRELDFWAGVG